MRNDPPSAIAALFAVVLVLELLLLGGKTGAALTSFDAIADHDKKVEAFGKLISAIGLLAAAPVGVAGVALAFWRSWNQHRDGLTAIRKLDAEAYAKAAEAFAKAVEQLGHDKSSIRMGAALALEALGKSTPRLLSQAIEVLCAYVREARPVSPTAPTDKTAETELVSPLPTDIQLILDIVNRLKREDKDNRIKIDLSLVDLRGARLRWANLSGADLWEANLYGADLSRVNLSGADLRWASLGRANLSGASLSGADLSWASLSWASLHGANLHGADLSGADLSGANLHGADLSGTVLYGANLIGATLTDTIFENTTLTNTIFENTLLPDGRVWTGKGPPPDPTPVTNA
ncbi:pentapeptide repeat-containing protein [Azospirillum cavernae]|nr:pentapeptide repeat-containing protein [Azospirillum cavernae]